MGRLPKAMAALLKRAGLNYIAAGSALKRAVRQDAPRGLRRSRKPMVFSS
jgi:hypothetical protein